MEAVLMHQAAARPARRLCVGEAPLAGYQLGAVRLGMARHANWGVRARPGLVRAHLAAEQGNEVTSEEVDDDDDAGAVRLFVGLPADVVSDDGHAVNHSRAIRAGLRALKLLGVDGVELPVSWAVVQPGASVDRFEWAGYLAVADMVRSAGLGLRVSLHTHGTALPGWVADAAAADPDILFTDREGNRREGCLSFAVDELPVLAGKSPLDAYEAFCRSFADAFQDFLGSTITDVTVSLGPNGELRYPSYPPESDCVEGYAGAGEFQCYDKHMLARLKRHADLSGQPLWGLSGPHDAPRYGESPESSGFFREPGGSWQTAYGGFFLSWYAGELLAHGDRVLAAASRVFGGKQIELSAKVPFLHQRSRPAAATTGLHSGYRPVAEMFARHACMVIVSGTVNATGSGAEELLAQIKDACTEHGAQLAFEDEPLAVATDGVGSPGSWGGLLTADRTRPCHFTYQRMDAEFFSPDHWPLFVQFARALEFPDEAHEDDLPADGDGGRLAAPSGGAAQGTVKEAQTA